MVIKTILFNIARMFLTKTVAIWALKLAAKHTKNKIDDNVVGLAEAGYNNDPEKMMIYGVKLVLEAKRMIEEDKERPERAGIF